MLLQKFLKAAAFSATLVACLATAQSGAQAGSAVSISNNSGGTIAAFAMNGASYRDAAIQLAPCF